MDVALYLDRARNELTEHIVYGKLAAREKSPANRELLERLSAQEKSHYEFWRGLAGGDAVTPRALSVYGVPLLRAVFGVTFITKLLETHEEDSIAEYERILPTIPPSSQEHLKRIIEDERSHEQSLLARLRERRVSYIGFVALGLADAIVEITGVHAGFLGVTGSTLIAGVAGVIVGFSAAISMGSAAYLQAKQDPSGKSPIISAFITGISYMVSVICLALPYFFIRTMITAFSVSTVIGLILLATFTFYGAVLFDRVFLREFGESTALMLGTALASFLLGTVVGNAFHLSTLSF